MAIKLEFMNVIVPNTTLEAVFAEERWIRVLQAIVRRDARYGLVRRLYLPRRRGYELGGCGRYGSLVGRAGTYWAIQTLGSNGGISALLRHSLDPPIAVTGLSSTPGKMRCLCEASRKDGSWERRLAWSSPIRAFTDSAATI
jgi:hypothetical protein